MPNPVTITIDPDGEPVCETRNVTISRQNLGQTIEIKLGNRIDACECEPLPDCNAPQPCNCESLPDVMWIIQAFANLNQLPRIDAANGQIWLTRPAFRVDDHTWETDSNDPYGGFMDLRCGEGGQTPVSWNLGSGNSFIPPECCRPANAIVRSPLFQLPIIVAETPLPTIMHDHGSCIGSRCEGPSEQWTGTILFDDTVFPVASVGRIGFDAYYLDFLPNGLWLAPAISDDFAQANPPYDRTRSEITFRIGCDGSGYIEARFSARVTIFFGSSHTYRLDFPAGAFGDLLGDTFTASGLIPLTQSTFSNPPDSVSFHIDVTRGPA